VIENTRSYIIIVTNTVCGPPGWGLGVEVQPYAVKKKIVEKPPRNSAGF
jgi:hypothetical protein